MGKRELVALLNLSSWCLVMVERLFLAVPWGSLRFVIVAFPDHTHLLFSIKILNTHRCDMVTSFKHYNDVTNRSAASVRPYVFYVSHVLVRVCEMGKNN